MRRFSALFFLFGSLSLEPSALAQSARAQVEPPAPSAEAPRPSAMPGALVIVASLALGAAVTAYGLTIDCAEGDASCQRRAALPIWGGVGIASAGSVLGLVMLPSPHQRQAAVLTLRFGFQ